MSINKDKIWYVARIGKVSVRTQDRAEAINLVIEMFKNVQRGVAN